MKKPSERILEESGMRLSDTIGSTQLARIESNPLAYLPLERVIENILKYLDEQHERTVGNFNANKQTNE